MMNSEFIKKAKKDYGQYVFETLIRLLFIFIFLFGCILLKAQSPSVKTTLDKNEILIDALGGEVQNPTWQYKANL